MKFYRATITTTLRDTLKINIAGLSEEDAINELHIAASEDNIEIEDFELEEVFFTVH